MPNDFTVKLKLQTDCGVLTLKRHLRDTLAGSGGQYHPRDFRFEVFKGAKVEVKQERTPLSNEELIYTAQAYKKGPTSLKPCGLGDKEAIKFEVRCPQGEALEVDDLAMALRIEDRLRKAYLFGVERAKI